MLIYKNKFFPTYFILLTYLYFLWAGLKGRAECRQTEVRQTERRSLSPTPKNWRTEVGQQNIEIDTNEQTITKSCRCLLLKQP